MPVLIAGSAGLPVSSLLFVGKVTRREALAFPALIDPDRADLGAKWINVIDASADMSDIDPDCLFEIKDRLRPVAISLSRKGGFKAVLVSNSRYNDALTDCWRIMTVSDSGYPSDPDVVPTVRAACSVHGLSAADTGAVEVWLQRELDAARSQFGV